jgi:hypothetical protein
VFKSTPKKTLKKPLILLRYLAKRPSLNRTALAGNTIATFGSASIVGDIDAKPRGQQGAAPCERRSPQDSELETPRAVWHIRGPPTMASEMPVVRQRRG